MKFNSDRLARNIANTFIKIQIAFALFMGRVTVGYSARTLKNVLIFCSVVLSVFCTWFIADAFKTKKYLTSPSFAHIQFIPVSKSNKAPGIIVTQREYAQLQKFRLYLDSLGLTTTGKLISDSIKRARPGLMDSVAILEKIYLSQQK